MTLNADGANNDVIIQSNGSTKVTVDGQNSRVGIGETSPDTLLHLKSDASSSQGIKIENTSGSTNGDAILQFTTPSISTTLGIDGTGTDVFKISNGTALGTNDVLTINSSNNVGIGTVTPARTLHVNSADANVASFEGHQGEGLVISSGTNGQIDIIGYDDGASAYNPIAIRSASAGGIFLDTTGAVTMPSQPCASFGWSSDISANSVIPANLIRVNTGSHLNSSGRFTAPVAGTYWYGYVGMSHNNTNNFKVELLKNGSLNGNDTRAYTHNVAYSQNSIYGFITLSANDYLEFKPQLQSLHSNYGQISIKLVA